MQTYSICLQDKSGSVSLDIQTIRKSAVNESNSGEETGIISSLLRRSKSKDVAPSHDSSTDGESANILNYHPVTMCSRTASILYYHILILSQFYFMAQREYVIRDLHNYYLHQCEFIKIKICVLFWLGLGGIR